MPLKPGHVLHGQYEILGQLGRGGFGFVYHARDTVIRKEVAIKELIPALVGDEATLKRFLTEARATMDLRHEHIVTTHTVFPDNDNYYIVMEYMPGGSLEHLLRKKAPLPIDDALRIAAEVCEALQHAHDRGIVHCDLKPANILFAADGSARLADFGIAHVSDKMLSRSWRTPAGFAAGTLPYMSPEQAAGVRDDPRIDLYALGALLYRMLTGRTYLDFDQTDTPKAQADNVQRISSDRPRPPSQYSQNIPSWLDAAVLKALAKKPDRRFPSAASFRQALSKPLTPPLRHAPSAASSAEPQAGATTRPRIKPLQPRVPTWVWPAAGIAASLAAVLLLVILLTLGRRGGVTAATPTPTDTPGPTPTATTWPTNTPHPLPTTTPPPAGRIVFASDRNANWEIYVMNADGSGVTRLTNSTAFDTFPSWSPDWMRVAFTTDRDGNREIYTMNADGTGTTRLTNNTAHDTSPVWSPDGTRIAFESNRQGQWEIYIMAAHGSGDTRLTNNPAADTSPAWSPDGTRIAFTTDRDGNLEIYVMNADGTDVTRLTNNPAQDSGATWSPDGMRIAFDSERDGRGEIYVMNADGSAQTCLTNNPAQDLEPVWSPDGARIAFISSRDGEYYEIYVMNSDGSDVTRLTSSPGLIRYLAWSP